MRSYEILDKIGGVMIILGFLAFFFTSIGWLGWVIMFVGVVIVMVSVVIRLREKGNK